MNTLLTSLFLILCTGLLVMSANKHVDEPLADPTALQMLLQGATLPAPKEEDHAEFHNISLVPPSLKYLRLPNQPILGVSSDEKRIEVDLTRQRVYAYEGDRKIYDFLVSTGKWGWTPPGEYRIWSKVRSQLMSGGRKDIGTYYYLPNVPYVMFFYNKEVAKSRGYSLHGTYWHSNFGHVMSHGCVNMKTDEAQLLYEWATPVVTNSKAWSTLASNDNPGTKVVIYGVASME